MMDDTIYRQSAIDAVCMAGCCSGHCGVSCDDVKAIETLPSAPPENPWHDPEKDPPPDYEEVLTITETPYAENVYYLMTYCPEEGWLPTDVELNDFTVKRWMRIPEDI